MEWKSVDWMKEVKVREYPNSTFKENTSPMNGEEAKLFAICLHKEWCGHTAPLQPEAMPLSSQIIQIRVEAMKLPISFSAASIVATAAFAANPGKAVVVLCDCLNAYEGKTVSVENLAEIYPWGFYSDEIFMEIVDEWMKTGMHKWAHVYNRI